MKDDIDKLGSTEASPETLEDNAYGAALGALRWTRVTAPVLRAHSASAKTLPSMLSRGNWSSCSVASRAGCRGRCARDSPRVHVASPCSSADDEYLSPGAIGGGGAPEEPEPGGGAGADRCARALLAAFWIDSGSFSGG